MEGLLLCGGPAAVLVGLAALVEVGRYRRMGTGSNAPHMTLLVHMWRSISNAIGEMFARGMDSVSLAFKHRM